MEKILSAKRLSASETGLTDAGTEYGQLAVCESLEVFRHNWDLFTCGLLRGLNWRNVFAAGGCVLACLKRGVMESQPFKDWLNQRTTGAENQRRPPTRFFSPAAQTPQQPHHADFLNSDVDLFVHARTQAEATQTLRHIYETVKANSKTSKTLRVIRTKYAVTILGEWPHSRHIQIVLRLYKSPAEVLMGFDIDACCVGFDGESVWTLDRCRRALTKQYNLVDLTRRSLTYESRLFKYSKRGFSVAVPNLKREKINPRLFDNPPETQVGLAKLLIYEFLQLNSRSGFSLPRNSNPRTVTQRRIVREYNESREAVNELIATTEGADHIGDYETIITPWGIGWRAAKILSIIERQDRAQFFNPERRRMAMHRHTFVEGIESVIRGQSSWCRLCQAGDIGQSEGVSVSGPLLWLTDNPGRQLLTGSFHPVGPEQWDANVYFTQAEEQAQQLIVAACAGDFGLIEELVSKKGVPVDSLDAYVGRSALHHAACFGHVEAVKTLLRLGANPALTEEARNMTPLHLATYSGSIEIVALLLERGVELALDQMNFSPLHIACMYGHTACAQLLLFGTKKRALQARIGSVAKPTKCAFCGLSDAALKRCSKCYRVGYCNTSCQKNHWSAHKADCAPLITPPAPVTLSTGSSASSPASPDKVAAVATVNQSLAAIAQPLSEFVTDLRVPLVSVAQCTDAQSRSRNCLHYAAVSGSMLMISLVYSVCPSLISSEDADGKTPLMLAAQHNNFAAATLLAAMGMAADIPASVSPMFMRHNDVEAKLKAQSQDQGRALRMPGLVNQNRAQRARQQQPGPPAVAMSAEAYAQLDDVTAEGFFTYLRQQSVQDIALIVYFLIFFFRLPQQRPQSSDSHLTLSARITPGADQCQGRRRRLRPAHRRLAARLERSENSVAAH
eukprot:TRINITY_DN1758_c0_g1_i12.p1 TRINITY_DN1758_c0_g1~~TRINITY_DN1758_c0_g1_i12.p1  ORF type:complete len:903 (+),score=178.72 TRINITY_DN1758_c0_g1_i12:636-3344(+)